jgi:hypothetical protein
MDKQQTILLYSKHSPACAQLFEHITSLPFDLVRTSGLQLLCIDNYETKKLVSANNIHDVPALIQITTQKVEGDNIYDWIHSIAEASGFMQKIEDPQQPDTSKATPQQDTFTIEEPQSLQPTPQEAPTVSKAGGGDIISRALSMQKMRESEDKIIRPS